jgi:hypothetical protein
MMPTNTEVIANLLVTPIPTFTLILVGFFGQSDSGRNRINGIEKLTQADL